MDNTTLTSAPKENNNVVLNRSASPYTLKEAATILRRSEKTVSRLIARGKLRRDETFWRVLIPRKDVDNYMEKNSEYSFSC
jgi:excisionase family DNA binding protein